MSSGEAVLRNKPSMLCISTYGEKGHAFITEVARSGVSVCLLTSSELIDAPWPAQALTNIYVMKPPFSPAAVGRVVLEIAKRWSFDSVVALHERDAEAAALIREEFRLPGAGQSAMRLFRDKLAMRSRSSQYGIKVPRFTSLHNDSEIMTWARSCKPPWLLKPRFGSGSIGIRRIEDESNLWQNLRELNERRVDYILEQFLVGEVFHVDSLSWQSSVVFQCTSKYGIPPMQVVHQGGVFSSKTLAPASRVSIQLQKLDSEVLRALGMTSGVSHSEYLETEDGTLYFLESSSRVAGGSIPQLIECGYGVDCWKEWAKIEVALTLRKEYQLDGQRDIQAAALVSCYTSYPKPSLVRFTGKEIVKRIEKQHQIGLVLAHPSFAHLSELLESYLSQFLVDFTGIRK